MEIRSSQNINTLKNIKNKKNLKRNLAFSDEMTQEDITNETPTLLSSFLNTIDPLFLNLNSYPKNEKNAVLLGNEILDELEKLKFSIINQKPSDTHSLETLLDKIQNYTQNSLTNYLPEELQEILSEIETRTIVEIAKIKKHNKKT